MLESGGTEREALQRDATLRVPTPRGAWRHRRRGGLTLVELLVVIIILTTVVAAAIPIMAPSSESRRLREAARSLQTAITSAQTQATEIGRPYGIWLEKLSVQTGRPEDRGAVLAVHFCEEPQPFSGFSSGSRVILKPSKPTTQPNSYFVTSLVAADGSTNDRVDALFGNFFNGQFTAENLPPFLLRPGDRVAIGSGVYEFLHPSKSKNTWDPDDPTRQFLQSRPGYQLAFVGVSVQLYPGYALNSSGPAEWTYPQTYTIRRQPQKVGDPLQLPAGVAIDLEASGDRGGVGPQFAFYHDPLRPPASTSAGEVPQSDNDSAVAILFSPGGAVHSVYRNIATQEEPVPVVYPGDGTIYLMVARRELIGASQLDPRQTSWLDRESLWVSIGPQTGRAVTEQSLAMEDAEEITAAVADGWDWNHLVMQRRAARELARQSQGMGGR